LARRGALLLALAKVDPPISSRTTMMSTPRVIGSFSGELPTSESEAKLAGRMFA